MSVTSEYISSINIENIFTKLDISENAVKKSESKNRCGCCQSKLKLTDLTCKCGQRFCSKHFFAELHNCTYDFKASAMENLKKTIDVGKLKEKLERI
jgi:predicted nucleic acid binding AN1-type Zn finger protein